MKTNIGEASEPYPALRLSLFVFYLLIIATTTNLREELKPAHIEATMKTSFSINSANNYQLPFTAPSTSTADSCQQVKNNHYLECRKIV